MRNYSDQYSEASFWQKLELFAVRAGTDVVEQALILYYCLKDPDTPAWAKTVIVSSLGYFVLPLDLMPDPIPGVGFLDDLGALAVALVIVALHVKAQHREQARRKSSDWFDEAPEDPTQKAASASATRG